MKCVFSDIEIFCKDFFNISYENASFLILEDSIYLELIYFLRILTRKKHRQIKLQRFQSIRIWAFWLLARQIDSLTEILKLIQNFQKNKVVTAKTLFFVISPFCTHHSFCLNILSFWYGSFVWKWCVFNFSFFN